MKKVFLLVTIAVFLSVNASNNQSAIVKKSFNKELSKIANDKVAFCERMSLALGGDNWDIIGPLYVSCMGRK